MNQAYVALGTNIEPRNEFITDALKRIENHPSITITKQSSIYETAPVGYTDQADFLNMVIELNTELSSLELLDSFQDIENKLGRTREIRFGPRTIDLDILLYNQESSKMNRLIIPHPRMHERAFVLVPLHEIAPSLRIPQQNKSVVELVAGLPEADLQGIRKWVHHQ